MIKPGMIVKRNGIDWLITSRIGDDFVLVKVDTGMIRLPISTVSE